MGADSESAAATVGGAEVSYYPANSGDDRGESVGEPSVAASEVDAVEDYHVAVDSDGAHDSDTPSDAVPSPEVSSVPEDGGWGEADSGGKPSRGEPGTSS